LTQGHSCISTHRGGWIAALVYCDHTVRRQDWSWIHVSCVISSDVETREITDAAHLHAAIVCFGGVLHTCAKFALGTPRPGLQIVNPAGNMRQLCTNSRTHQPREYGGVALSIWRSTSAFVISVRIGAFAPSAECPRRPETRPKTMRRPRHWGPRRRDPRGPEQ
jgi:hypothetical protein